MRAPAVAPNFAVAIGPLSDSIARRTTTQRARSLGLSQRRRI